METTEKSIETKWGFVASDYDTYKKIKAINYELLKQRIKRAAEDRWWRKEEQNRVSYRWIKNEQGQRVGKILQGPTPEPPKHNPSFFAKIGNKWSDPRISDLIDHDYRAARYPKATAGEVEPLKLTAQQIDELHGQIGS